MASASDFFVATLAERLPILVDQLISANVYLNKLRDGGRIFTKCGGDGFSFPVRRTRTGLIRAVGDWTVGQAKTAQTDERITAAYRAYAGEIMFSRNQQKRNQYADKTAFDYRFAEEQLNGLYQDFEDYLGADLCGDGTPGTGDEATPIDGLQNINDTNNTYLDIDRTTTANAWWRANTRAVTNDFADDDDGDGVVNGLKYMRLAFLDACVGAQYADKSVSRRVGSTKSKPSFLYTNLTSWNNYAQALAPQQQYVGGKNDHGQEVAFFGVPILWDNYAASDRIDIINEKVMHVRVVGETLIYVDCEDELGLAGSPRVSAIGLVAQLQHLSTRPSLLSFVTNTD